MLVSVKKKSRDYGSEKNDKRNMIHFPEFVNKKIRPFRFSLGRIVPEKTTRGKIS